MSKKALKDPVCKMTVHEEDARAQSEFEGKKFYFCSDDCKKKFEQKPSNYVAGKAA
jgi:YHS domain-containing protein